MLLPPGRCLPEGPLGSLAILGSPAAMRLRILFTAASSLFLKSALPWQCLFLLWLLLSHRGWHRGSTCSTGVEGIWARVFVVTFAEGVGKLGQAGQLWPLPWL